LNKRNENLFEEKFTTFVKDEKDFHFDGDGEFGGGGAE
jgi:hypothetical protein